MLLVMSRRIIGRRSRNSTAMMSFGLGSNVPWTSVPEPAFANVNEMATARP
jgi:hypothetical protein